jgi:hypothetical protein
MSNQPTNLYYKFTTPSIEENAEKEVHRYLEEGSPRSSSWFSSLNLNTSKLLIGKYIPSMSKFIQHLQHNCLVRGDQEQCNLLEYDHSFSTAKTCPGLKTLLTDSILVKAPCDILITIKDTGEWVYKVPSEGLITLSEDHGPEQFGYPFKEEDQKLFETRRIIKFSLPIQISTEGVSFIYLDPQLHSKNRELTVINGVIGGEATTRGGTLNIITMYELPQKGSSISISIKKGSILAYLWASRPLKLKHFKDMPSTFKMIHDKFIGSLLGSKI